MSKGVTSVAEPAIEEFASSHPEHFGIAARSPPYLLQPPMSTGKKPSAMVLTELASWMKSPIRQAGGLLICTVWLPVITTPVPSGMTI
jgi:hypothetical protein